MAFRDFSNDDPFDRDDRRRYQDPRGFDDRSGWEERSRWEQENRRSDDRYRNPNRRQEMSDRNRDEYDGREGYYRPPFGTVHPWRDDDDPYIRDQRIRRERGELQYGRDYGRAESNHFYHDRRRPLRDPGSENLDAQQNYERDRPDFRGGGWDQGEPMRSGHMMRDRSYYDYDRDEDRRARDRGRYTSDPDAWSSMEHDWSRGHYYGGGRNRTGDYGSSDEPYNWRDNFGKDRVSSRSGRGTTTGWTGGDRSLGSSDLGR